MGALLIACVLVASNWLLLFLLLILFFVVKLFRPLVLRLHHLLQILNLLWVQFVSKLLCHSN